MKLIFYMQININILSIKDFYKLIQSLFVAMIKYFD